MVRIVIIGNGAAGNQAAKTIRKHDNNAEIIMLSQETFPEYSACALPDCLAGWIPRSQLFLKDDKDYKDEGIDTRFGSEVIRISIENKQVLFQDETVAYDKLIMATGSRAIIPPLKGTDLAGNYVLKSVSDLEQILEHGASRVVVVGSGNIGVEAAEALEIRGCEVSLIELVERLMPRNLDEKASSQLRSILEENNVQVFTGEKVVEVCGIKQVEGVNTDKRRIACDIVIWAVGVRQNIELAREAGINIGELGGIRVNRRMETSVKDIYACGDCIESFDIVTGKSTLSLLWPSAKRQAEVAALNSIGRQLEYEGSLDVVVEEIYGTNFVSIGPPGDSFKDYAIHFIEQENSQAYYRLAFLDDRMVGLQLVGNCEWVGAITSLIKNGTPLAEIKRVLNNPELLAVVPWYLEAGKILFPDMIT